MTQRQTRSTTASKITVKVGRFGEATTDVKVCKGSCASQVLNDLGITYNASQPLLINGSKAFDDQELKSGDRLQVIGNKEGGADDEPVEETEESTPVADETADEDLDA